MKKRYIFISLFVIAMIVGVAVFNMNLNTKSDNLSNVSLGSVEANAFCEAEHNGKVVLTCTGDSKCSKEVTKFGQKIKITCDGTEQ